MSGLNRGRKISLFTSGIALLGGRIVIRGNFGHAKVTPTVPQNWQAEDGHCYARSLPWPAYWPLLHSLLYSRAGNRRDGGFWSKFEIVCDHPLFMNVTAKKLPLGLGVAILGCCLYQSFYGKLDVLQALFGGRGWNTYSGGLSTAQL